MRTKNSEDSVDVVARRMEISWLSKKDKLDPKMGVGH